MISKPDCGLANLSLTAWVISALLVLASSRAILSAATVTFADTEFADIDWTTTILFQAPGVTASNVRQLSGGNPGAYREYTTSFSGAHDFVNRQAHIYGSAYEPAIQGGIASVVISFDSAGFSGHNNAIFDFGFALEQGGSFYGQVGWGLTYTDGNWYNTASIPLTSSYLTIVSGSGPTHPDFSPSGAAIRFGYFTDNSFTFANSGTRVGGIDNWSAVITQVPEPSSLALVLAACCLWGFQTRNRQSQSFQLSRCRGSRLGRRKHHVPRSGFTTWGIHLMAS
jgi:hypothetical protein